MNREELSMNMFGKPYDSLQGNEKHEVEQEMRLGIARERVKAVS